MKALQSYPLHELPGLEFLVSDGSTAFGEHAPNHRINFYALIWFLEDKGVHYIDFESLPIQENTVYLLSPNQVHSIPSEVLPKARVIVCSANFHQRIEELALRQLFYPFHNKGITIPPAMVAPMQHLFELLLLEYQNLAEPSLLLKYTVVILMHLQRFADGTKDNPAHVTDKRILHLLQLLQQHYKEERDAGFYATQVGLTAKRMNELLRERMNTTISQLLYHLLLIEAKRELYHQYLSVKEIAYDLGFSDQSYFARFFKKHTGISPEAFRSSVQAI